MIYNILTKYLMCESYNVYYVQNLITFKYILCSLRNIIQALFKILLAFLNSLGNDREI